MNNITVVAENTMQLQEANNQLIEFFKGKMTGLEKDAKEIGDSIVESLNAGFDTKKLKGQQTKLRNKLVYYDKIINALQRGYTIIPAVWQGISIAVKTDSVNVPNKNSNYRGSSELNMKAKRLPVGEGRYVCPETIVGHDTYCDGDKEKNLYFPIEIKEEIELPISLAKPQLIAATKSAMQHKVFDAIQVVDHGGDPMVIGVINGQGYKQVCFLIAWWLDTKDI